MIIRKVISIQVQINPVKNTTLEASASSHHTQNKIHAPTLTPAMLKYLGPTPPAFL